MPDIKYSVTLSTGEKVTLDENQFNERQEKLFKADPNASAIRVSSYVPDDDDQNEFDQYRVRLQDGSEITLNNKQFQERKDKILASPDVQVVKASDMSARYWKPKREESSNALNSFNEEHGQFMRDYERNEELASMLESENVLNSGIQEFVEKNRADYEQLRLQREQLRKDYYTNPLTKREYEGMAYVSKQMSDEYRSKIEGAADGYERRDWRRAAKMMDDARKLYEAPSQYVDEIDNENGFIDYLKGYKQGTVDKFTDRDFLTRGISAISRNIDVRGISKKLQDEKERLGRDLVESDMDKILSPSEKAEILAFAQLGLAQKERAEDLASAYTAGSTFADSIGFMAEFLVSQGLANVAGKALSGSSNAMKQWLGRQLMSNQAMNRLVSKGVMEAPKAASAGQQLLEATITKPLIQGLWHTGTQLSTYANISDRLTEVDDNGELISGWRAFGNGVLDSIVENYSESFGQAIDLGMDKAFAAMGYGRDAVLGKGGIGRFARWMFDSKPSQVFKEAGFNGMLSEMLEEWVGNAARVGLGLMSGDEFKDFASMKQQLEMAASFAPLSLFGLGSSTMAAVRNSKKSKELAGEIMGIMRGNGFSDEQINDVFNTRFDTASDIADKLAPVLQSLRAKGESAEDDYKKVLDFAGTLSKDAVANEYKRIEDENARNQMREEIQNVSGKFWTDVQAEGEEAPRQVVNVITYADGSQKFIIGRDGDTIQTVDRNGKRGFTSQEEIDNGVESGAIASVQESSLDEYVEGEVQKVKTEDEARRMSEERQQTLATLKKAFPAGQPVTVGTEEEQIPMIVAQQNDNGIVLVDDLQKPTATREISWAEAAALIGIPFNVKTDAQLEQEIADQYDAAEKRKEDYNATLTPGTEITVDMELDGENKTPVKFKFNKAVTEEGQVILYVTDEDGNETTLTEDQAMTEGDLGLVMEGAESVEPVQQQEESEQDKEEQAADVVSRFTDQTTGEVDETGLWNEFPEDWCRWNDSQRNDNGADSIEYVNGAIKRLQAQQNKLVTARRNEADFKKRKELEKSIGEKGERITRLQAIVADYANKEEQAKAAAKAQERLVEQQMNEPQHLEHFVAQFIYGQPKGSLNREDWQRETGKTDEEMSKFFAYWAKEGTGKTVKQLAEEIAEHDDMGFVPMDQSGADQKDSAMVRSVIIDLMRRAVVPSDLGNMTRSDNEAAARREEEYYGNAQEEAPVVEETPAVETEQPEVVEEQTAEPVVEEVPEEVPVENPVQQAVAEAREEVDTNPTDAQKEAGNYRKGHVTIDGYDITIENPKGSVRSGKDASGKEWRTEMRNDYGYIRGTKSVDGDQIDVFLSDNPAEGNVFVIDQIDPKTGEFDEHKVMYGFNSAEEAQAAYLSNYEEGWKGMGTVTEVSKEEFKKWVDSSHRKTKPFSEYKSVKADGAQNVGAQVELNEENYRKAYDTFKNLSEASDEQLQDAIAFFEADKARNDAAAESLRERMKTDPAITDLNVKSFSGAAEKEAKMLLALQNEVRRRSGEAPLEAEPKAEAPAEPVQGTLNFTEEQQQTADKVEAFIEGKTPEEIAQARKAAAEETTEPVKEEVKKEEVKEEVKEEKPSDTSSEDEASKKVQKAQEDAKKLLEAYKSGDKDAIKKAEKAIADYINQSSSATLLMGTANTYKNRRRAEKKDSPSYKMYDFIVKAAEKRLNAIGKLKDAQNAQKTYSERFTAGKDELESAIAFYEGELEQVRKEMPGQGKGLEGMINNLRMELQRFEKAEEETADDSRQDELERQKPLQERIAKWKALLGDVFEVLTGDEGIDNKEASDAISNGETVRGWYETGSGKAVLHLPHIKDAAELDRTILHEVLSHKGIRAIFQNKEDLNKFLDKVWEEMSKKAKDEMLDYVGTKFKSELERQRAAADEYVAHVAENNTSVIKEFDETAWTKIVDAMKRFIEDMLGVDIWVENDDFGNVLRDAITVFAQEEAKRREANARDMMQKQGDLLSAIEGETTPAVATAQAEANPQVPISRSQEKYEDFGNKIGEARKDTALPTGKKGESDGRPAWAKKYSTSNVKMLSEDEKRLMNRLGSNRNFQEVINDITKETDYSQPFVGFWDETIKSAFGNRTRRHYITDANRNPIIFSSREQYEAVMPVFEAMSQRFRVIERDGKAIIVRPASNGKMVEYASFDKKEDAVAYLATPEGATELLNRKRENYELPALSSLTRNGMPDYRNGRNVTPDDILKTFGFYGGEFGNWLNAEERQQFLNLAYDSLMDLASIIGVTPRALSLGGALSIAFGARGRGGDGAAAHYEPGRVVINLTKMKGAGSLAHEWAHALDNYFGMMAAKKTIERGNAEHNREYLSSAGYYAPGVRKEIRDAISKLMTALTRKEVTREIAVDKAQEQYDGMIDYARRQLQKHYREDFVRGIQKYQYNRKTKTRDVVTIKPTEEQIAKYDELCEKLLTDPTFKFYWETKKMGFRAKGDVAEQLYDLVKDVMPNRAGAYGPLHNAFYYLDKAMPLKERLEKAKKGEKETVTIETTFYEDSKWFDRDRAGEYWTKDIEMFARAFESVVAEKMKREGKSSDYLTYLKGPLYQAAWEHNPYPAGEEMETAIKAFDNLFDTIQEKEDENGNAVLFSRGYGNLFDERDLVYERAIYSGDMETAQQMVNEAAKAAGYNTGSYYQGRLAFNGAAPSRNGYFETREERKTAFEDGSFEDTYSLGDFMDAGIDNNDLQWQLDNPIPASARDKATLESINNIGKVVKGGEKTIKMYRAVPSNVKEDSFRNGDWVTPSRLYAEHHIELQDWKGGRIIEQDVPVDNVWWNGDDINEWGYDDGNAYAYKNTKNNRKLLDPVTYDDNGNIIPLSERFDSRKADTRFSKVTDQKLIDELEAGEKETGYRNVVMNDDGTMGSPMASKLGKKGAKPVKTASFAFNEWEQAEENPDMATEDGKINLGKPDGLGNVDRVDYNPYIHIRPTLVNRQFTGAWKRDNLVYIETQYPASELTSGYKAEKAAKSVGRHAWNGGDLILSRYDKPVRVVPWEEVADDWMKESNITFDIVPPGLLPVLASRGVEILPPKKAAGKDAMAAYESWMDNKETRFSRDMAAQKQPGAEYPDGDELLNETRFSLSKNNRNTIEAWMRKRNDISKETKDAVVRYLDTLDNPTLQLATAKWFCQGVVRLPEDMPKIEQAVSVAGKAKVDPLQYDSPMALLEAHANFTATEKRINPDEVNTLHRITEIPEVGIVIYEVDESDESRENMRKIINTHFGKEASPWCLLQGDGNGNLTPDSKRYWNHYDAYTKKVAFKDGKLLAFSANDNSDEVWWDRSDEPNDGVPVTMKIEGDELGRSGTYLYFSDGRSAGPKNVFRGNQQNGVFERWFDNGQLANRKHFKDGREEGLFERWFDNGQIRRRYNIKDGEPEGLLEEWYNSGQQKERSNYKNGVRVGLSEGWWSNGNPRWSGEFNESGLQDGEHKLWHENGQLSALSHYKNGKFVGEQTSWFENGNMREHSTYNDSGHAEGVAERWWGNGILSQRRTYKDGKLNGLSEAWYDNGNLAARSTYNDDNMVGKEEEFYVTGATKSIRFHNERGALDGEATYFNLDGTVFKKTYWNDGHREADVTYYKNGNEREKIAYDSNGDVLYDLEWNEDGTPITGSTRFSKDNANQAIFVSNAEQAVKGIPMEKATPEQWIKMLESKGGLKAGEDKWLGLSDWLKASDKKTLTKQEVSEFIGQHKIQIEEVNYSDFDNGEALKELQEEFDALLDERERWDADHAPSDNEAAFNAMVEKYGDDFGIAFGQIGGQLYVSNGEAAESFLGIRPANQVRLDYTTEGLDNKREIALTVPTIEPYNQYDDIHFGDAGGGRAIAWARFGDATKAADHSIVAEVKGRLTAADEAFNKRVRELKAKYNVNTYGDLLGAVSKDEREDLRTLSDESGNTLNELDAVEKMGSGKVLFIDEIQSKRHQEGREKGYSKRDLFVGARIGEYEKRTTESGRKVMSAPVLSASGEIIGRINKTSDGWFYGELANGWETSSLQSEDKIIEQLNILSNRDGIPAAPFEKNWHELTMKRMLRLAAEEGYDYVAWTTGEQQAERYDIGNVVDSIGYDEPFTAPHEVAPSRYFVIRLKNGTKIHGRVFTDGEYKGIVQETFENSYGGKPLSDVVGKAIANEIIGAEGEGELKGEGLRIGASGMMGFYDKMLPEFMNKYGKKWGVKVEDINLRGLERGGITAHAVKVTPEMKESVMAGQTMFSKEVDSVDKEGLGALIGKENVSTFYNDIYKSIAPEIRDEIISRAEKDGWNLHNGLRQYLSDKAAKGYENDETGILRLAGLFLNDYMEEPLDEKTLRYVMWRAGQPNDILTDIQAETFKRRWGIGEDDTRFSKDIIPSLESKYGMSLSEEGKKWFEKNILSKGIFGTSMDDILTKYTFHLLGVKPFGVGQNIDNEWDDLDATLRLIIEKTGVGKDVLSKLRTATTNRDIITDKEMNEFKKALKFYPNLYNELEKSYRRFKDYAPAIYKIVDYLKAYNGGLPAIELCYVYGCYRENENNKRANIIDKVSEKFDSVNGRPAIPENTGTLFSKGDLSSSLEEKSDEAKQKVDNAAAALEINKKSLRGDLLTAAKAMAAQKDYDKYTIETITNLAKELLKDNTIDALNRREIARILGVIRTSVGKSPRIVKNNTDALVDIIVDHLLKREVSAYNSLIRSSGTKLNATGVEVQGNLDVRGQNVLKAYKAGLDMEIGKEDDDETVNSIYGRLQELSDRKENPDDAVRKEAEDEYEGLTLALEYKKGIKESIDEEKSLLDQRKEAAERKKDGKMSAAAYNEYIRDNQQALLENKIERIEAYREFRGSVQARLDTSSEAHREFVEREKARREKIQHFANSDMEGMSASPNKRDSWIDRFVNSSFVRFFTTPLSTFDQMLRLIGRKSVSGEGYLHNYFMNGWREATENTYLGVKKAEEVLNNKVSEVFGEPMHWSGLYDIERKMPKVKVTWFDDGEMKEHELTQGNLLYIYMVNKMADGRMKLRRMGITDADVKAIERQMDDRFLRLADWIQDEFLVNQRNKYNAVHERLFGASMAAIDNYFPLKINKRSLNRKEDIGNMNNDDTLPSTTTGSIIKRRRNSQDLDLLNADAFSVVIDHINEMEKWAAHAEFNHDINMLLSYKKFRNRLQNMATVYGSGKQLWENFKSVCRIAGETYHPAVTRESLDAAAVNLAKGVTGAKISFRAYTALKQLLSMPAFVADANIMYLGENMVQPWKAWNWAMDNLPMLEKRWRSRISGETRLMETESDWKFLQNKVYKALAKYGMTPNAFVDAVTISIGARAMYQTKYDQYIKEGYPEDKADKKAKHDATVLYNETQQSNEGAFVSPVQLDRTLYANMLTVFRNASMGYQRQLHDALRNLGKMMSKGYKEESIAFMTKQMMRDGLTEEQAKHAANRRYEQEKLHTAVRIGTFGFLVQFAWNLGSSLIYLLFGDDDDKKKAMLVDAARHAAIGGFVEGLAGGNIVSDALDMVAKGENLRNYDPSLLPIFADIKRTYQMLGYDKAAAVNELFNLAVQAGIGVNPQTLTDAVVAVVDACGGDLDTSKEALLLFMRVMQVPQSQLDDIYIDELGVDGRKASKMKVKQMAERYAKYKVAKGAPLSGWAYPDELEEKREKAYIKKFNSKVKERNN